MFVEGQVPVLGLFLDEWIAIDGIVGVDEFFGRKGGATLLALVSIGAQTVATRTFATDIAVGQELMGFLVVELFGSLLDEFSFVVKLTEEIGSKLVMNLRCGAGINVERYAEVGKRLLDQVVVTIDNLLYGDAFLACTDGDRYAVFVGTTDKQNILTFEAKVADVDVSRYIYTCEVTDMDGAVGVWQGRGH